MMIFRNIVRSLCPAVVGLGLLAIPSTQVLAQPATKAPPTNPTRRMGFLLQIYDPDRLLGANPLVNMVGTRGSSRTVRPADDGNRRSADVTAGDRIFSAPVPSFPDPGVQITIKSQKQSWSIKVTLDPNNVRALVFLRLSAGKVEQTSRAQTPPSAPRAPSAAVPSETTGSGALLQLHDPQKLLQAPPLVTLTGLLGQVKMVKPRDSGLKEHSDAVKGDQLYSAPLPPFPGGGTITVRSGTLKWVIKVTLDSSTSRPLVLLKLQSGGRISRQTQRSAPLPRVLVKDVVHPSAPGERAAKGRPGFLLQIYDPKRYLKQPPTVTLRGSMGTERIITPHDSGKIQHSDVQRGDRIFSGPAPFFTDGVVNITIRSVRRVWQIKVKVDQEQAQSLVFLQLFAGDKVKEVPRDVAGKPQPPNQVGLGRNLGGVRTVIPTVTRTPRPKSMGGSDRGASGFVMWALLFVTLGLGIAITWALTGRRPRGAARLAAADAAPIAPVRLELEALDAALDGPLARQRVVVLGETPRQSASSRVIRCLERHPLPDELVSAVERLAVVPGPALALLVSDPELLDRAGPADPVVSLQRRVAGRFPLWVVDGPREWEEWKAEIQNTEHGIQNRERGTDGEPGTGNRGTDGEQGTGNRGTDGEQGTVDGEPKTDGEPGSGKKREGEA